MSHLQYLDELVKEYLLFRGFSQTLRSLDNELKIDKDKGFRVDRLVDQVVSHIQTYDLSGLRELWAHLDTRIFTRLPHSLSSCVRKLETSLLRLYVVNTIQTSKPDKLLEFLEKMAPELQNQAEWRDWFILPYLKGVEENPSFAMYFTRQWQDTLLVSLHNFLAVVFQSIDLPTLASYKEESSKMARLQEERELLRARLAALTTSDMPSLDHLVVPDPPPPPHLMDDFYNIAQEPQSSESQLKSLKTILFSLGGGLPTSPILGRRTANSYSSSLQPSPSTNTANIITNNHGTSSHPSVRRTLSQASEEKKRTRSSSVAGTSATRGSGDQHAPVKRLVQGQVSATRSSRSPTKNRPQEESSARVDNSSGDKTFISLGQEEYGEHRAVVTHAVFNPSGNLVASADTDGVVKLWAPSPAPKTQCGLVVKSAVTAVEWLPRGERHVLLATKAATLRLFDVKDKKTVWDIGPDNCSMLKDQRILEIYIISGKIREYVLIPPNQAACNVRNVMECNGINIKECNGRNIKDYYEYKGRNVKECNDRNEYIILKGCNRRNVMIMEATCHDLYSIWASHLSQRASQIVIAGPNLTFSLWITKLAVKGIFNSVLEFLGRGGGGERGGSRFPGKRYLLMHSWRVVCVLSMTGQHILKSYAFG
ncbi:unnamed protein product, partial [Meganyctiphanes norvegica]